MKPVALTQKEVMDALTLGIPLYTHPVKELTDKEIMEVAYNLKNSYEPYNINFARAILRKAQKK